MLVEHAPNVATHELLAGEVWGARRIVTPDNLSQHVALLRRALGEDSAAPRYIEAVRGEGYRLIAPVRALRSDGWLRRFGPVAFGAGVLLAALLVALLAPSWFDVPADGSPAADIDGAARNRAMSMRGPFEAPFVGDIDGLWICSGPSVR